MSDHPIGQFLGALILIALWKGNVIQQPPMWDSAFTVHMAATELANSGFDIAALFKMLSYHQGGPNAHSSSVVTWVSALFYLIVPSTGTRIALLHIVHFAVAALGLTVLWRALRGLLGDLVTLLLVAAVLLQPAVSTQVGSLYMEISVWVFSALALYAWSRDRLWLALLSVLLATWVKPSGLIAVGTLATASLLQPIPWPRRLLRSALAVAAALPGLAVFLASAAGGGGGGFLKFKLLARYRQLLAFNFERYLLTTPDLLILLLALPILLVLQRRQIWGGLRHRDTDEAAESARFVALSALFCVFFVAFFYFAMPVFADYFQVLVRYHVAVLPFLLLLLVAAAAQRLPKRALVVVLVVVCALFAVNRRGLLYPKIPARFGNDFSIAERSEEYVDLLAIQQAVVRRIAKLDARAPVFFELPLHFLLTNPALGYVDKPPRRSHCIFLKEPYRHARLWQFPRCFYLAYVSPWLGGERIRYLVKHTRQLPGYSVVLDRAFDQGAFSAKIYRVQTADTQCPP